MKKALITSALILGFAANAYAEGASKPCTTEPKEKWQSLKSIEAFVTKHGYKIEKSKIKKSCYEIYARDLNGARVEFFIDPVTGFVVEADQKRPLN